ncbi:MAG: CaiB/BaiF CoA-transferase family protein [Steroidobacteraceae bacterium]|jgi:alpha-methylacyl-CoA racemase|nr:CaiB/BaiF CoA-transferase family protein [Steroidobacteraceae bacterium]
MLDRSGPLSGIRIVELDAIGPVPLAAMLLADLGANVVRIVRPPEAGSGAWSDVGGDILHRSRDMAYLNLKDSRDREQFLELVGYADALMEGFRPGVMERLGLGPDVCLARNQRLAYGRMTGWGQSGPLSPRAGHDINYVAITGALHAMGRVDGPPGVPLNLVGDYGGGAMFLVSGLLAAILSANRTGVGGVVDACITDGVSSLMSLFYAWLPKGAWRDEPASNLLDGGAPFYRCYRCADGRDVAVGCLEPQFFAEMVRGLGLEGRGYDQNDRRGWPAMAADFDAAFATRTRDEWAAYFANTDACVTPVLSMEEAPKHPHNRARRTFIERNLITQPAPAPRITNMPSAPGEPQEASIAEVIARWRSS